MKQVNVSANFSFMHARLAGIFILQKPFSLMFKLHISQMFMSRHLPDDFSRFCKFLVMDNLYATAK